MNLEKLSITLIQGVNGYNLLLIMILHRLVLLLFVEMEHIVLVEVEEEHVLTMVELQDGYKLNNSINFINI